MTTKNHIDPVRIGEEIFYNIFHHIFHDQGAREYFGFSKINFFNNNQGLPGWNLWFQEKTGAYQLALVQAEKISGKNRPAQENFLQKPSVKGRFAVRYFPDADDPELDNFAFAEALLRLGPLFDDTGTPNLTGQDCMDETSFVVGYLDFRTTTDRNFLELECIAPNIWKDVRVDGLWVKTPENKDYQAVTPKGIDRNVPGWDLVYFIFDKLISGCCYAFKTTPRAVIFAEKKWHRFDISQDNSCIEIIDPDIDLFHLAAGFEINDCCNGNCSLNSFEQDIYIQDIIKRLSDRNFLLSGVCKKPEDALTARMNPQWWSVQEKKFSIDIDSEMHHCCYH